MREQVGIACVWPATIRMERCLAPCASRYLLGDCTSLTGTYRGGIRAASVRQAE